MSNQDRIDQAITFLWSVRPRFRYAWVHASNYKLQKDFLFFDNKFMGIEGLTVRVVPPPVAGRRKHRMIADLVCGRTISAGRLGQHMEACKTCTVHYLPQTPLTR